MERMIRAYKNYFTDFITSIGEIEARKVFSGSSNTLKMGFSNFVRNTEVTLLFNGYKKKSQKTPRKEIEQAKKLKNEYYAEKGK